MGAGNPWTREDADRKNLGICNARANKKCRDRPPFWRNFGGSVLGVVLAAFGSILKGLQGPLRAAWGRFRISSECFGGF